MRVSRLFRFFLLVSFIVVGCSLPAIAGGDHPWSENPNSSSDRITDSGFVRSSSTDPDNTGNTDDTLLLKPLTSWMMFFQFLPLSTGNGIMFMSAGGQKTTGKNTTATSTSANVSTVSKRISDSCD